MPPTSKRDRLVKFYTRSGCHLCETAKQALEKYRTRFGLTIVEIDIDQDLCIHAGRHSGMPCEHHQGMDPLRYFARDPGGNCCVASPGSTLIFIVGSSNVVNRIVKPKRELDFPGMLRQLADLAQAREALGQVLDSVIVAMRLCVTCKDIIMRSPKPR